MIVLEGRKQSIKGLAFSPESNLLAVAGTASHVQLWDLKERKVRPILGPKGPHHVVAFLGPNRLVSLTTSELRCLRLPTHYDRLDLNRSLGAYFFHGCPTTEGGFVLVGQTPLTACIVGLNALGGVRWYREPDAYLLRVAPLIDGRVVASGLRKTSFLQLRNGTLGEELSVHFEAVPALAVDPTGKYLAEAAGTHLKLIPLDNPVQAKKIRNDGRKHFTDVAFHPSGQYLLVSCNDSTVRLYDRDLTEVAAFDWQLGPIRRVAFSPDGMRAAAGNRVGQVVLWDVDW
ncbi:MAG: WD40 repeat domain-containing protein [Gemmataceae bacterium]